MDWFGGAQGGGHKKANKTRTESEPRTATPNGDTSARPVSTHLVSSVVTRGQARTIYDAAMCVRDIIGPNIVDVVVREKDSKFPSRDALCIDKAREQLGYDPQINLEQGLQSYYDWFTHFYPDIHWFNETI